MSVQTILPPSTLHQSWTVLERGILNQKIRASVAAENYVNADSTGVAPGSTPYRRKIAVFKVYVDGRTGTAVPLLVRIGTDKRPFHAVYRPEHPAANAEGNVLLPNVNRHFEVMDYQEANLTMAGCIKLYELNSSMIDRLTNMMIVKGS
jgi:flagellar basal-body rod protein FlgC